MDNNVDIDERILSRCSCPTAASDDAGDDHDDDSVWISLSTDEHLCYYQLKMDIKKIQHQYAFIRYNSTAKDGIYLSYTYLYIKDISR